MPEVIAKPKGYGGGVNLRDAPNQIAPNQALAILNMILDENGGASKRLGSVSRGTFGISGERAISMYTFYRDPIAPQILLQTDAGKLYYTTDFATFTLIVSGLSTTAPFSFETFNSKVYMSNGVDDYASWNGTTRTAFASAPKGKYLRLYKDTMWVSGVTALPDRVYSSNAADAEVFGVSSWVDIAKGDGDTVMAIHTDGTFLIVWKLRRHWVIYDPVTFANRLVDYEKGCESHFSVMQHDGRIYFLSRRGICVFLGDSPSQVISDLISPVFTPSVINLGALNTTWAYVHENRIGWVIPEATSVVPTLTIEFYPRLPETPFTFHRLNARCFARIRTGATEKVYMASTGSNKFLEVFAAVGTDDAATFQGIIESGWFDFDAPTIAKYLKRVRVIGRGKFSMDIKRDYENAILKNYTIDLTAVLDTWDIADIWSTAQTWGPATVMQELLINTDLYGRYFQFRFIDAETGIGSKQFNLGGTQYTIDAGKWAVYGVLIHGEALGVRN